VVECLVILVVNDQFIYLSCSCSICWVWKARSSSFSTRRTPIVHLIQARPLTYTSFGQASIALTRVMSERSEPYVCLRRFSALNCQNHSVISLWVKGFMPLCRYPGMRAGLHPSKCMSTKLSRGFLVNSSLRSSLSLRSHTRVAILYVL